MLGNAAVAPALLKSKPPSTWQAVQLLRAPGNSTSPKPEPGALACQEKSTVRFLPPWIEWIKSLASAAQPLLVRFGLWQNAQVWPSLRCPAWNVGAIPSAPWQVRHLALST